MNTNTNEFRHININFIILQLVEPELLPADVRAAMQSEYNTSYNTKADTSTLNQAVIQIASSISTHQKTPTQTKTSVLSKMVNSLNKTIPYPLVMSAAYLLGHGDSWCPMKTVKHDFGLFQRSLQHRVSAYEDISADHTFIGQTHEAGVMDDDIEPNRPTGNPRYDIYAFRGALQTNFVFVL